MKNDHDEAGWDVIDTVNGWCQNCLNKDVEAVFELRMML